MIPLKEKLKDIRSRFVQQPQKNSKIFESCRVNCYVNKIYIELPHNKWTLFKISIGYDDYGLAVPALSSITDWDIIFLFRDLGRITNEEIDEFRFIEQKESKSRELAALRKQAKEKGYKLVKVK